MSEQWEERFDRGINPKTKEEYTLLEWDDYYKEALNYPESPYELDPEKVKSFIAKEIKQAEIKAQLKQLDSLLDYPDDSFLCEANKDVMEGVQYFYDVIRKKIRVLNEEGL